MPRLDPQAKRDVEVTIATIARHKYTIAGTVKALYDVPPEDREDVLAAILHSIDRLGLLREASDG